MDSSKPSVSWVLAARDPHKLATFYACLLQTEAQRGLADHHWIVPLPSGGSLQIYTPSRHRPWPAQVPCWHLAFSGSASTAPWRTCDPGELM